MTGNFELQFQRETVTVSDDGECAGSETSAQTQGEGDDGERTESSQGALEFALC